MPAIKQNHIIRQQVFEVNFPDRQRVHDFYNKTSNLLNHQLTALMEELFDSLVPPSSLVKLDRLEIDLGVTTYAGFEDNVIERLIPALEKELKLRLGLQGTHVSLTDTQEEEKQRATYADLLAHFLETGTLPWWATGDVLSDPSAVFNLLLAQAPGLLTDLLRKAARYDHVRRRLVYQFSEAQVRGAISLLEPGEAAFIFEYHEQVVAVQREKQVVKNETSDFRRAVLLFIITYLFTERGSHFDRRMFVKSTLVQMSAYYNISYESILLLFSSALHARADTVMAADALPVLIGELLEEYIYTQPAWREGYLRGEGEKNREANELQKEQEALKNYLVLGYLPWPASPLSAEELAAVFFKLERQSPGLLRQMINEAGKSEAARKRMVELLPPPLIYSIVKLAEPANADFIINYVATVEELQATKYIVKAQRDQFSRTLWEFILAFLFVEKSSVFNARMFVERHVRRIAQHYNLHFSDLLLFLVQDIGEGYRSLTDNTSLFYLLTGILKEQLDKEPQSLAENKAVAEKLPAPEDKAPAGNRLLNILAFWLQHGYMPWWAKDERLLSPDDLMQQLLLRSPQDTVFLLRLSATANRMRQRLLYQLAPGTLLKMMQAAPGSDQALGQLDAWLRFAESHVLKAGSDSLQRLLVRGLWNAYHDSGFGEFNEALFTRLSFGAIAGLSGLPAEKLLGLLEREDLPAHRQWLAALDDQLQAPAGDDIQLPDIYELVAKQLSPQSHNRIRVLDELQRLLDHFLTWQQWPDHLKGITPAQANDVLRQILRLLYRERREALKALMAKDTHTATGRMRLHDLFIADADTEDRSIKALLGDYLGKDIARYLAEIVPGAQHATTLDQAFERVWTVSDQATRRSLLKSLVSSASVARHAAYHYRDRSFFELAEALAGPKETAFLQDLQLLLALAGLDSAGQEKLNALFREFSLPFFSRHDASASRERYVSELFDFLSAQLASWYLAGFYSALLGNGLSSLQFKDPGFIHVTPLIKEEAGRQVAKERTLALLEEQAKAGENPLQREQELQQIMDETAKRRSEEDMKEDALRPGEDKVYIRNAGMVLLHPFLPMYFNRLGLMENGKFIDDDKRRRAVHLLEYLVTGEEGHEEHLLVLNKLMCGLAPGEPVEKTIVLTGQEREVSESLLHAVIQQWSKIGNTSVAGLRETFLQREGTLAPTDEFWLLRVQQKGIDVLLQFLPWAFSMIKTGWMPKAIHVEWT